MSCSACQIPFWTLAHSDTNPKRERGRTRYYCCQSLHFRLVWLCSRLSGRARGVSPAGGDEPSHQGSKDRVDAKQSPSEAAGHQPERRENNGHECRTGESRWADVVRDVERPEERHGKTVPETQKDDRLPCRRRIKQQRSEQGPDRAAECQPSKGVRKEATPRDPRESWGFIHSHDSKELAPVRGVRLRESEQASDLPTVAS